jgi:hypothetical protein
MVGKGADLCGPVKGMKITTAKIGREQPAFGGFSVSCAFLLGSG